MGRKSLDRKHTKNKKTGSSLTSSYSNAHSQQQSTESPPPLPGRRKSSDTRRKSVEGGKGLGRGRQGQELLIRRLEKAEADTAEKIKKIQQLEATIASLKTEVSNLKNSVGLNNCENEEQEEHKTKWAKKISHRKKMSKMRYPTVNMPQQSSATAISGADGNSHNDEKNASDASNSNASKVSASMLFTELVYQYDTVQSQIDAGIHMVKRAKKFMAKMAAIHTHFACDLIKAAAEEKLKVKKMRFGDRMNSCRDAFLMILVQSENMASGKLSCFFRPIF